MLTNPLWRQHLGDFKVTIADWVPAPHPDGPMHLAISWMPAPWLATPTWQKHWPILQGLFRLRHAVLARFASAIDQFSRSGHLVGQLSTLGPLGTSLRPPETRHLSSCMVSALCRWNTEPAACTTESVFKCWSTREHLDAALAVAIRPDALKFLMELKPEQTCASARWEEAHHQVKLSELGHLGSARPAERLARHRQTLQAASAHALQTGLLATMLNTLKRAWYKTDPAYQFLFKNHRQTNGSASTAKPPASTASTTTSSAWGLRMSGQRPASQRLDVMVKPTTAALHMNANSACAFTRLTPETDLDEHGLPPLEGGPSRCCNYGRTPTGGLLPNSMRPCPCNRPVAPIGIPPPNQQIEVSALYYDLKFKQNPDAHIDLRLGT